jgi:hypothetical protein
MDASQYKDYVLTRCATNVENGLFGNKYNSKMLA